MKKFRRRRDCGKSVLLLEPNYPNKYPPVGLMKLATYHRIQGWNVVFFKGDLTKFVAERLTYRFIGSMESEFPGVNWGKWFGLFCDYVWKGRDCGLSAAVPEWGEYLSQALNRLKDYRGKYLRGEYFGMREWDRVLVTTLFTFYADVTVETIEFAKRLVPSGAIQVGGIMASVVPDYIKEQTGITPSTGVLYAKKIFDDKPIAESIDNLPLDYSILEEIDYRYPAEDAFFGHTTRGCPNKCAFCAVPVIEPQYQSFRGLKDKLAYERKMFGERPNLLLMDNNVFASDKFGDIVEEIKACGFGKGAKAAVSDPLALCAARIREGYNPRAYVKKGCGILREWAAKQKQRGCTEIFDALGKYGVLGDWHGVSEEDFLCAMEAVGEQWRKSFRPSSRTVAVDFNQGLDARLGVKGNAMELLAELPVKPVRIAFDHWKLRKNYESAIAAAAKAGFGQMSNYILYNFNDTPEELYWRLRLNVALCEELDVPIYSFPMKYHPIKDPKYFSNRDYLGKHWRRMHVRFVQMVLNSTMGKVGRGKTFFLKAFGESTEAFGELMLMPEYMVRDRYACEAFGETERWREALHSLTEEEQMRFRDRIDRNDFKMLDEGLEPPRLYRLLTFYQKPKTETRNLPDAKRKRMIAEFDEKWSSVDVRMTEAEIAADAKKRKEWVYSF